MSRDKAVRDIVDGLGRFGIMPEKLPPCTGACSGKLAIVGGGRCVWADLLRLGPHGYDYMCINDIGMHLPVKFQHWFSNHGDQLPVWNVARTFRYKVTPGEREILLHSCFTAKHNSPLGLDLSSVVKWPWPGHGSSGLNACYTGLALGYESIVLAGVPYDGEAHYYDPPSDHWLWNEGNSWPKFGGFRRLWTQADETIFKGRVKSMSGMTRDVLGAPA